MLIRIIFQVYKQNYVNFQTNILGKDQHISSNQKHLLNLRIIIALDVALVVIDFKLPLYNRNRKFINLVICFQLDENYLFSTISQKLLETEAPITPFST